MTDFLHNELELHRYIDNEMDEEERLAFEEKLKQDPALSEQVHIVQASIESIRLYGLHKKVRSVRNEMNKPRTRNVPVVRMLRYGIGIAAAVLLVMLITQTYSFYQLSNDKVYDQAYIPFEEAASRNNSNEFSEIEELYNQKNYATIIGISKQKPISTDKEKLLVGLSYMNQNDFSGAIQWLKPLTESNSTFNQDAQFYLGLSYLKEKNYDKSLLLLQQIRFDESHLYHERISKKLIRKIKMLKWK